MRSLFAILLLAISASLAACSGQTAADPSPAPVAPAPPTISWDHPFQREGQTVSTADLLASPKAFGVDIQPQQPAFSTGKLRWVDVSAGGTVAFLYDFAGDPRFAADARVQVEEEAATMTPDQLTNGTWQGTESSVTFAGAIAVLLRSHGGLADATFIHGGVMDDVTGPALGPDVALYVAKQLALQVQRVR